MMGRLGFALACAAIAWDVFAQAQAPQDPAQTVRELSQRNEYWLCERSRGGADGHRRWCAVATRAEHCKAWAAGCAQAALPTEATATWGSQANSLQGGDVQGGDRRRDSRRARDGDDAAESAVLPWLRDILVGAVLALVAWLVWRIWRLWRTAPVAQAQRPPDTSPSEVATFELHDPRTLPDVDVALARARALAAAQPGAALAWLYAAALRHLHDGGTLHWHPALGNRAALRMLTPDHPLRAPLRDVIAPLEQWRFAGRPPDLAQVDRALRTVAPLLRTTGTLLLTIGLAACTGGGDTTVTGRALTWDLLRAQGWDISGHRLALRDLQADSPTLWVDAEDSSVAPATLAELRDAACRGGRVVLFAGNGQSLAPVHAGVVDLAAAATLVGQFGPMPASRAPAGRLVVLPRQLVVSDAPSTFAIVQAELADLVPDLDEDPPEEAIATPAEPCELQREPQPLLWLGDQPAALRWRAPGGGSLVVVADNDLLANAAMSVPDNARALVAIARDTAPDRKLALLVPQQAPPAADAADSLAAAGLLPFLAQGLVVLAVAAWMRAARFGAARAAQADRRRAFTDHVAALAQLLRLRSASRWPAAQLCALGLDRLQRRLGPTDLPTLAERVAAARPGADPRSVRRLLERADALRIDPSGADHPEDARTARALDELVAELDRKMPPPPTPGAPWRTKGAP